MMENLSVWNHISHDDMNHISAVHGSYRHQWARQLKLSLLFILLPSLITPTPHASATGFGYARPQSRASLSSVFQSWRSDDVVFPDSASIFGSSDTPPGAWDGSGFDSLTMDPNDWYKKQLLHFRYPAQKELYLTDTHGVKHHMVFKDNGDGLTFDGVYYRLYSKTLDCYVTIKTFRGAEDWVYLDVRTQTFIPITSNNQVLDYAAIATLVRWFASKQDYVAAPKPGKKEASSWFVRVQ